MDHDRLALFLAGYTTGGFRRSLQIAPQATLTKMRLQCRRGGNDRGLIVETCAKTA